MVATHPEVSQGGRRQPSPSYAAGMVPDECDRPLDTPPATAEALVYRDDLAGVRDFTARSVRRAGLIPRRVGRPAPSGQVTATSCGMLAASS